MSHMDDFSFCFCRVRRESFEGAEDSIASTAVFGDVLTGERTAFGDLGWRFAVLGRICRRSGLAGFEGHGQAFSSTINLQLVFELFADSGA